MNPPCGRGCEATVVKLGGVSGCEATVVNPSGVPGCEADVPGCESDLLGCEAGSVNPAAWRSV